MRSLRPPKRGDRQRSEQIRSIWPRLRRFLSVFAGLFAVVWLPTYATKPPATVFGNYVGFAGKGKTTAHRAGKPIGTVHISRSQTADARVTVFLRYDKGQVCELEGDATWTSGQLLLATDGLEATKPCQLVLRINGSLLTLTDSEDRCREVYCGTRGAFSGTQFRKKP